MHAAVLHSCTAKVMLTLFANCWLATAGVTASIHRCDAILCHYVICIASCTDIYTPGPCMQAQSDSSWGYRQGRAADLRYLSTTYACTSCMPLLKHLGTVSSDQQNRKHFKQVQRATSRSRIAITTLSMHHATTQSFKRGLKWGLKCPESLTESKSQTSGPAPE